MQPAKEVPNIEDKEVKGAEDKAAGCRVHRKHRHRDRGEHRLQRVSDNFRFRCFCHAPE